KDGNNYGAYANPEVDRLLDEVRQQVDPQEAKARLVRAQEILHAEQPYTFLWESQRLDAASRRLQDPRPNALSTYFHIREWWVSGPRCAGLRRRGAAVAASVAAPRLPPPA